MAEAFSAEMVARRFAEAPAPRRAAARPRGDHDLNPELYQPGRRLTPAAVLVPIVEREAGLTVLLTRRTDHADLLWALLSLCWWQAKRAT